MKKINILVIQNIEKAPVGLLGNELSQLGAQLTVVNVLEGAQVSKSDREHYDALIVLGGPMGPECQDAYPNLSHLLELIQDFHHSSKPFLGICLGAQLFMKAMGMPSVLDSGWEIGFTPIKKTVDGKQCRLLQGTDNETSYMQLHKNSFQMHPDASLLMSSQQCQNQAFQLGDYSYGLQFHPEITAEILDEWKTHLKETMSEDEGLVFIQKLLHDKDRLLNIQQSNLKVIASNWYEMIVESSIKRELKGKEATC
ncbi:type 1 glutamine amidotransferase [Vibrio fluvialis]|nr:type 1 glutamine amidotransferase [Vibrio fluvialis]